jgi:hypothetical protein
MSEGLGMRYAFLGPLETAHLNAEGISEGMAFYLLTTISITFWTKPACFPLFLGYGRELKQFYFLLLYKTNNTYLFFSLTLSLF